MRLTNACLLLPLMLVSGCGTAAQLTIHETTGPAPTLTTPKESLVPTINVVSAKPWPEGAAPVAATGTTVMAFARELDHPRWLHVLPNGDVLVAETNAPERPEHGKGVKGWFFNRYQKKAGGAVPSANRITLLRDSDGDGTADVRGRPVGVVIDNQGALLVADDVGNTIWRVTAASDTSSGS